MENQAAVAVPDNKPGRINLFSIKPYGDNLCTPGANYWIVCMRLVIIVMALSEAIAWGYLGSLFGRGAVGYIAAGIAFSFVFLIIWIIDVSFVTLDMSKAHYDNEILKKKTSSWIDTLRVSVGLLGRVAIVVVSLSISAPFIAQIVFMQDIDNEMEGRNIQRVAVVSDSLLAQKDAEIAELDTLILQKENELITETAGKGASGNYGFGPVTQAMERNIQGLKAERAEKIAEKEEMTDAFAMLSIEEFARRYNVDLVDNGVQARGEILNSLTANPEYRTAKRAITAFLAFIFAALVLLKLFQPRSVQIYYNEKLQDLYREYLSGTLNKWIAKEEHIGPQGRGGMSPLRFEDWSVNTYGVVRSEDIHRRESSKLYNAFRRKIEQLEDEKHEVKIMLEPVQAEYEKQVGELNELRMEVMHANNEVDQNERSINDLEVQLQSIDYDLQNGHFRGQDLMHAVQAKKNTEARLAELRDAMSQLKYNQNIVKHRYQLKKDEAAEVEQLNAGIRNNYRRIQEKIDDERLKYTDLIVSGKIVGGHGPLVESNQEQETATQEKPEAHPQLVAVPAALPESKIIEPAENGKAVSQTDSDRALINEFIWEDEPVQTSESVSAGVNDLPEYDLEEEAEPEIGFGAEDLAAEYEEELEDEDLTEVDEEEDLEEESVDLSAEYEEDDLEDEDLSAAYDEEDPEDEDVDLTAEYDEDDLEDADLAAEYDEDDLEDEGPFAAYEEDDLDEDEADPFAAYEEDAAPSAEQDEDDLDEEEATSRVNRALERSALAEEEDSETLPLSSYKHYPLLINGLREEEVQEGDSPVEYVDDRQLKKYADSASMAAYEDEEARKDRENSEQNEERKSDNFIEVLSPHDVDVAPEAMDAAASTEYSGEVGEPKYYWDDMEADTTDLPVENQETNRIPYAWDALESTPPDQRKRERDEPVEERAEEEDQPQNFTDPGEAESLEDIEDYDGPEAPNQRTRRPSSRRTIKPPRRLGKTGDWMIG